MQELTRRTSIVDGAKVSYRTNGFDRGAVVLIHGWGCNSDFWKHQIDALSERGRVVVIDLPGHGASEAPPFAYTVDRFAESVHAVLKDAGVERATLVGHSMGTAVALALYRAHPERVEALVVVDGALRPWDIPEEQKQELVRQYAGPDWAKSLRTFVAQATPANSASGVTDWVVAQAQRTPQHVLVSAMEGLLTYQGWSTDRIRCPLAVIDTNSPFWTDEYKNQVRAMAPDVIWRTIPDAGHFLMLEKPQEFEAALLEVLDKVQSRR
jgi:pimeloyl-ACP methyl ester carboxylesterase